MVQIVLEASCCRKMKIKVPEAVIKQIGKMADGRRLDDVEIAVDKDSLSVTLERTGEMINWSRAAYEAENNKVSRSFIR